MSRALDKSVIAALKQGDHEKIFNDISGILVKQQDDRLLEIEILGSGHTLDPDENFLRDDNAVAVPKLRLVQAFIVARDMLQKHLVNKSAEASRLWLATGAMLLMDPEHLTAANTRKRLLQAELSSGGETLPVLMREKWFVDSLLTSRLHRHTKSPTLWSHRRWLSQQLRDAGLSVSIQQEVETVVMIAAERHPRNYYAWCHARWLTKTFQTASGSEELISLTQSVKKWSFRHHNDISGWSFLAHLLQDVVTDDGMVLQIVFKETLDLAESLRWQNESVWWFLRTMASSRAAGQSGLAEFIKVQEKLAANAAGSRELNTLQTARNWCDLYSPRGDAVLPRPLA